MNRTAVIYILFFPSSVYVLLFFNYLSPSFSNTKHFWKNKTSAGATSVCHFEQCINCKNDIHASSFPLLQRTSKQTHRLFVTKTDCQLKKGIAARKRFCDKQRLLWLTGWRRGREFAHRLYSKKPMFTNLLSAQKTLILHCKTRNYRVEKFVCFLSTFCYGAYHFVLPQNFDAERWMQTQFVKMHYGEGKGSCGWSKRPISSDFLR